jgi:hypothetical protein
MKGLKTFALSLAVLAVAVSATAAIALNGVTSPTVSAWYGGTNVQRFYVHVWSATTSTATVKIEVANANDGSEPGYAAVTITNPSSTGEYWIGNGAYVRVNATAVSGGTIYATVEVAH